MRCSDGGEGDVGGDGADGDQDGPPNAEEVLVSTMATISPWLRKQDNSICPLLGKRTFRSVVAKENCVESMA